METEVELVRMEDADLGRKAAQMGIPHGPEGIDGLYFGIRGEDAEGRHFQSFDCGRVDTVLAVAALGNRRAWVRECPSATARGEWAEVVDWSAHWTEITADTRGAVSEAWGEYVEDSSSRQPRVLVEYYVENGKVKCPECGCTDVAWGEEDIHYAFDGSVSEIVGYVITSCFCGPQAVVE